MVVGDGTAPVGRFERSRRQYGACCAYYLSLRDPTHTGYETNRDHHDSASKLQIDSLLGGVFQPTYFSKTRSLVVHSPEPSSAHPDDEIVRVPGSGWDVLSNNAVNAVSTLLTAAGAACYASL